MYRRGATQQSIESVDLDATNYYATRITYVVVRGLDGEKVSGGEGHEGEEEKEHDLLHDCGGWGCTVATVL
jgi:hypothetical protein